MDTLDGFAFASSHVIGKFFTLQEIKDAFDEAEASDPTTPRYDLYYNNCAHFPLQFGVALGVDPCVDDGILEFATRGIIDGKNEAKERNIHVGITDWDMDDEQTGYYVKRYCQNTERGFHERRRGRGRRQLNHGDNDDVDGGKMIEDSVGSNSSWYDHASSTTTAYYETFVDLVMYGKFRLQNKVRKMYG